MGFASAAPGVSAWPSTEEALRTAQAALAAAAPPRAALPASPRVAGCFVCFPRGKTGPGDAGDPGWAAVAAAGASGRWAIAVVAGAAGAPYAPGLLALREGPLLEAAVRRLRERPDVLLVDATGADHPRGAGLALHLGAVLDLPTVGVTHRPLVAGGAWPGPERGATAPLVREGREVARWLRTRAGTRPLAVHAGWRVDPDVAVALVLGQTARARTPEPLRRARQAARRARAAPGREARG